MRLMALWWWIDRWRKSTAYIDMSLEEQGAYRNLLDEAHLRAGILPDNEDTLAKACGDPRCWKRVRTKVLEHFTLTPEGWRNSTLDEVMKESLRRAANQANYRSRRDNKRDNAGGNTDDNNRHNNPDSPVPVPVLEQIHETRARATIENPKAHLRHSACGRVCLPEFKFRQFVGKLGGKDPESRVLAWAGDVLERWAVPPLSEQTITGGDLAFWDARYDEWQKHAPKEDRGRVVPGVLESEKFLAEFGRRR